MIEAMARIGPRASTLLVEVGFGSCAAVPVASDDRPLLLQLRSSYCVAANRRIGPEAVIPVSADAAWIHFMSALLWPACFGPTTAAQLAQGQRVQQD
jgi:hypothetical protein